MKEPEITINGIRLSESQAMAVRVAIDSMFIEMNNPEALGPDDHGRKMASGYQERCQEIIRLMRKHAT